MQMSFFCIFDLPVKWSKSFQHHNFNILQCARLPDATYRFSLQSTPEFRRRIFLRAFIIYGPGDHIGYLTQTIFTFVFLCSNKLSHEIKFQIIPQCFRKTGFNFKFWVTIGYSQFMTMAFDIYIASFTHLVECIY